MERIDTIKKKALIINQFDKNTNPKLYNNAYKFANELKNIYHFSDEDISIIVNDNQNFTQSNFTNILESFVSRGSEWYLLYYIGSATGIEKKSEDDVTSFNDILNININRGGNIFNLIPLGSRLTVWLDYNIDYKFLKTNGIDDKDVLSILPNLSEYVHDYYEDEKLGEYSLSVNTPGNIICFQTLSYYYPSTKINNEKSLIEIAFEELQSNPNINFNQFIKNLTSYVNKNQSFKKENSVESLNSKPKVYHSFTRHSNSYLYENKTNLIAITEQSSNSSSLLNSENKNEIENENKNASHSSISEPHTDESKNNLSECESSSVNNIAIIPKLFSAFINKNYIKEESFIPYEKYKYKILKELVSTAHAQLYLVTEKNVAESGGFSHSSLNLNINSNSLINFCDDDGKDNNNTNIPNSPSSKSKEEGESNSKVFPFSSKRHVLKIIHLANDKNSLTVESEKKYKKTIKEALFLRELNHNNIQKFITSWADKDKIFIITEYCDQGTLKEYIMKKGIMNKEWKYSNGNNPYLGPGGCLNEIVIRIFYKQLVSAIEYIHKKKIIHRDIKPQNIMLVQSYSLQKKYYIDHRDDFENTINNFPLANHLNQIHFGWQENEDENGNDNRNENESESELKSVNSLMKGSNHSLTSNLQEKNMNNTIFDVNSLINYQYLPVLKIVDFGLAFYTKSSVIINKGHIGTLQYMAPEVVNGNEASFSSDLWSIGATIYECMTGECPYRYRTRWKEDKREKDNEIIKRPSIQKFSYELKYVVSKMLSHTPEERPSYSKYNEILFNYLPQKCISDVKNLESEYEKEEEKRNLLLKEKEKELQKVNSCIASETKEQVKPISNNNSNKEENSTYIDNNVYILTPNKPTETSTKEESFNNKIIASNDNNINNTNNNGGIGTDDSVINNIDKSKSKIFIPELATTNPNSVNDDEYEYITIHKESNFNYDSLFKPKKEIKNSSSKKEIDYTEESMPNSISYDINNYNNDNENRSIEAVKKNENVNVIHKENKEQQQQPVSISKSTNNNKLLENQDISKSINESLISQIDIIEPNNEKETITIIRPTIYRRKQSERNIHHNNEWVNKSNENIKNQFINHYDKEIYLDSKENNDEIEDGIEIVSIPLVSDNNNKNSNNNNNNNNNNENINTSPKRQSKIYKFQDRHIINNISTINNNDDSDNHSYINISEDEQTNNVHSKPLQSSNSFTASSLSNEDKKLRKKVREPRRYIKQNYIATSNHEMSMNELEIQPSSLEPDSSVLPSELNDLIAFNNINISNNLPTLKYPENQGEIQIIATNIPSNDNDNSNQSLYHHTTIENIQLIESNSLPQTTSSFYIDKNYDNNNNNNANSNNNNNIINHTNNNSSIINNNIIERNNNNSNNNNNNSNNNNNNNNNINNNNNNNSNNNNSNSNFFLTTRGSSLIDTNQNSSNNTNSVPLKNKSKSNPVLLNNESENKDRKNSVHEGCPISSQEFCPNDTTTTKILKPQKSISNIEKLLDSEAVSIEAIKTSIINNINNTLLLENNNIPIVHSPSTDSLVSVEISSNSSVTSSSSYKKDYNPCSSNSSRKGCYNYRYSDISETNIEPKNELDQSEKIYQSPTLAEPEPLIHRRVKKIVYPLNSSTTAVIPNMNILDDDIENEDEVEHDHIIETIITEIDQINMEQEREKDNQNHNHNYNNNYNHNYNHYNHNNHNNNNNNNNPIIDIPSFNSLSYNNSEIKSMKKQNSQIDQSVQNNKNHSIYSKPFRSSIEEEFFSTVKYQQNQSQSQDNLTRNIIQSKNGPSSISDPTSKIKQEEDKIIILPTNNESLYSQFISLPNNYEPHPTQSTISILSSYMSTSVYENSSPNQKIFILSNSPHQLHYEMDPQNLSQSKRSSSNLNSSNTNENFIVRTQQPSQHIYRNNSHIHKSYKPSNSQIYIPTQFNNNYGLDLEEKEEEEEFDNKFKRYHHQLSPNDLPQPNYSTKKHSSFHSSHYQNRNSNSYYNYDLNKEIDEILSTSDEEVNNSL